MRSSRVFARPCARCACYPVLCASGLHNIGTDLLLNFILDDFPAPADQGPWKGTLNGKEVERQFKDSEPVSAFVFKTVADPFAGRVSYFKVVSGIVKNDANLVNVRNGGAERLAHIGALFGKTIQPVPDLHAGDIGAVAKLKETLTGDTLADKASQIAYPPVMLPEPSIAYAISAKTRNDEDRMGHAVHKILEEDQALRFYRDPQTKEFLLAGTGQQHVEVIVSRLKKRYGVDVELHAPKIPYRETIRGKADVQGRHKKQTGGHGQFGDCWIRVEPLPRGAKFSFENEVFGGAIPRNFIPAIEKGIVEAAEKGYLAGFPVVDFKVVVYDGSYHDVDSSEMSFKLAARKAFRAAMEQAKPTLLEPVMNVEVQAPVEYAGDLMGDMNGRRGRIAGMDTKGGTQIIKAQVPMSEMLSYQNDLTSMTQGRATFSMEFSTLRLRAATAGRKDDRRRQGRQGRRSGRRRVDGRCCAIIEGVRKTCFRRPSNLRSACPPLEPARVFRSSVDRETSCEPVRSRALGAFERQRAALELSGRDQGKPCRARAHGQRSDARQCVGAQGSGAGAFRGGARSRPDKPNRHAYHDMGLATENLVIQAVSMGLAVHHDGRIQRGYGARSFRDSRASRSGDR